MADFLALKRSGHFWDNTENLPTLLAHGKGLLLNNTAGKGASTLLSLLRYYMDRSPADLALFADLAMAKDPHFPEFLGKYRTFLWDFSDYSATTLEDTVDYLYRKAEDLYCRNTDLFYPHLQLELARTAIGIHNRTLDPSALCRSFRELLRYAVRKGREVLLLVDNAVLLEAAAEKADEETSVQLRKLVESLLPHSLAAWCDVLVLTNALPERRPDGRYRYTCQGFEIGSRAFDDTSFLKAPRAVPPEHQFAIAETPPAPAVPPFPWKNWDTFFAKLQRLVEKEDARIAREAALAAERERQRYLLPPPKQFPKVSPNLGARGFSVPTDTPQYQVKNELLKALYRLRCESSGKLYAAMQNLDKDRPTDLTSEHAEPLGADLIAPARAMGWDVSPNHSYYWLQYSLAPASKEIKGRYNEAAYIKTYLSFPGEAVRQPFLDLVFSLLRGAKEDIVIKVSRYVRDDTVCCWLRPGDLPVLKAYALQHAEELTQPLPFVPYWHGIGLTRELNPDSYNSVLSDLFFRYFATVSDEKEVSLAAMLDRYAQDWNCYDEQSKGKKDGALTFLLVLDSFSVLLGELQPEHSVLLLDNRSAFWALKKARCWNDLADS